MPSFSVISSSSQVQNIVQSNMLERMFHDALFPALLFRMDVEDIKWQTHVGDNKTFTGKGLITPNLRALVPGRDPTPKTYQLEQWSATMQQYADTIDTNMPASIVAIADLFLTNAQQLGLQAGQSLNRLLRDIMYDAALTGNTMANGGPTVLASTSGVLPVLQLNGLTLARNPLLSGASTVAFAPVSPSNPLQVFITTSTGSTLTANIVGYTGTVDPVTGAIDTTGPGSLNLTYASGATINDRAAVISVDASVVIRAGGGNTDDTINTPGMTMTLQLIRSAVAQLRTQNVQAHPDKYYHAHFDPATEAQIFADTEWQRLNTALPDWYAYQELAIGRTEGTIFLRNNECPQTTTVTTVAGAGLATAAAYTPADPFAGILQSTAGINLHRALFSGFGGCKEYYVDLGELITEVGLNGKTGEPQVTNDGITVFTDRIALMFRAPLDRLQQVLSTSWNFIGSWPVRTDAATGGPSRIKRLLDVTVGE